MFTATMPRFFNLMLEEPLLLQCKWWTSLVKQMCRYYSQCIGNSTWRCSFGKLSQGGGRTLSDESYTSPWDRKAPNPITTTDGVIHLKTMLIWHLIENVHSSKCFAIDVVLIKYEHAKTEKVRP